MLFKKIIQRALVVALAFIVSTFAIADAAVYSVNGDGTTISCTNPYFQPICSIIAPLTIGGQIRANGNYQVIGAYQGAYQAYLGGPPTGGTSASGFGWNYNTGQGEADIFTGNNPGSLTASFYRWNGSAYVASATVSNDGTYTTGGSTYGPTGAGVDQANWAGVGYITPLTGIALGPSSAPGGYISSGGGNIINFNGNGTGTTVNFKSGSTVEAAISPTGTISENGLSLYTNGFLSGTNRYVDQTGGPSGTLMEIATDGPRIASWSVSSDGGTQINANSYYDSTNTVQRGDTSIGSSRLYFGYDGSIYVSRVAAGSGAITWTTGTNTFEILDGARNIYANSLSAGSSAYTNQAGDIGSSRNAYTATGVIYLGSGGSHYVYFDGSNYYMPGGSLILNGTVYASKRQWKTDIKTIDDYDALATLHKVDHFYSYCYRATSGNTDHIEYLNYAAKNCAVDGKRIGFMATDAGMPLELVGTQKDHIDAGNLETINTMAVLQLEKKIKALEAEKEVGVPMHLSFWQRIHWMLTGEV